MSQTLSLSDDIYARLQIAAQRQGASVEEWIAERLPPSQEELVQRREWVQRLDELRARVADQHGVLPDSTALLREDRER